MDLKRLAAKQKRYNSWLRFTETELQDQSLKPTILKALGDYRNALAAMWTSGPSKSGEAAPLEEKITSLERILEQLNNEARLRVPGTRKTPSTPRTA